MAPFANFKDFKECQKYAKKRGVKNTGAYCGAIESKIRRSKAMKNFKGVRKEAQSWVAGMGDSVTDKEASKRIGIASKKAQKSFVKRQTESLEW